MYLTDENIKQIISDNCGDPPKKELLEYHIWLNTWKLKYAEDSRVLPLKGENKQETIDAYKRLISIAEELLLKNI